MTEAEEKTRSQLKFRRAEKTLIKIIDEELCFGFLGLVGAEFIIDAVVVVAMIATVIAGTNSSCGKGYWSVSVRGFWRL